MFDGLRRLMVRGLAVSNHQTVLAPLSGIYGRSMARRGWLRGDGKRGEGQPAAEGRRGRQHSAGCGLVQ